MNIFNILVPKLNLTYLNANDSLDNAVEFLLASGFSAVPVIDDEGKLAGIVSEGDFLRVTMEHGRDGLKNFHVADIMHLSENDYVYNNADNDVIMSQILDKNFLAVIDDRKIFSGIITRKGVMVALKK